MLRNSTVFIFLFACLILVSSCNKSQKQPADNSDLKQPKGQAATKLVESKPVEIEITVDDSDEQKLARTVSFHDKCADILRGFVDEDGMVDYRMLKRNRLTLKHLMSEFENLNPNEYKAWSKEDKIAFWINAYNIQMLNVITKNYPIESSRIRRVLWPPTSIRHIPPISKIGASKWNDYKFIIMDEEFTLTEIERRFFSKEFNEPTAFLGLTQASLSSPCLSYEPYHGNRLYKQLKKQIEKFLSNQQSLRVDREKNIVYLSAIFQPNWYGRFFIDKYGTNKRFKDKQPAVRAVLNFVTDYISEEDRNFIEMGNYSVAFIKYDWRLNE